ncbi:hypothetical protein [Crenalkalicoccus roseus]|uniref:hypothetical protein n=1 Tax=Crenalkalicoccus roseus TaxID=1485588 RepID=UPI001081687A|nr:hypothetical protein [Crenalkalicoccus roseus]
MTCRTALLFQTHFFDRGAARVFARLRRGLPAHYEPWVLIHLPPGAPVPPLLQRVPHHVARTPELRFPPYVTKCGGADWNLWNGGHTDLVPLHFLRAHPEYDRAWLVEYDVRFSGPWYRFFGAFEDHPADFIVPVLRRRTDQPDWMWWHTLRPPVPLAEEEMLCAFMPVWRVSRAGWQAVDAAWRAGWAGHSETVWPTAIARAGLTLLDPGGDGPFTPPALRGRFYSSTMQDIGLAPGTLMWKPPLLRAGSRPDMLWHPVKPFWPRVELRQAVRDLRMDLGAARRRLFARLLSRGVGEAGRAAP